MAVHAYPPGPPAPSLHSSTRSPQPLSERRASCVNPISSDLSETGLVVQLAHQRLCSSAGYSGQEAAAHEVPPPAVNSDSADRKSTRLNSSHVAISYAVFCLK